MKGVFCKFLEDSAASVAPYTILGSTPALVFLGLMTLLVMLYSDVDVLAAFRLLLEASREAGAQIEIASVPLAASCLGEKLFPS